MGGGWVLATEHNPFGSKEPLFPSQVIMFMSKWYLSFIVINCVV